MVVNKDSPNRRRSIAVSSQNSPYILPRPRRRAYSIVSSDRLSPRAKARRSLAPRKSILKTFTNTLHVAEGSSEPQSSQPRLQAEQQPQSQMYIADEDDATQSMDLTTDFHERLHDNNTMKTYGARRVSFADTVFIREFDRLNNNTNSTGSPQSSPVAECFSEQPEVITDENAYPGAAPRGRRRSSLRYSIAASEGEDMDLTMIDQHKFFHVAGSDVDDRASDDMEVTEVISGNIFRKRSLSIDLRHPLMPVSQAAGHEGDPSFASPSSQAASHDLRQGMTEYTMPLKKPSPPPAEHDKVWLALREVTHSGHTPAEPHVDDGMDLDLAVQRLKRVRDSLSSQPIPSNGETQSEQDQIDDTISSTDDSIRDDTSSADQTLNISKIYGLASEGDHGIARMSMGSGELPMDESEIYGAIVQHVHSTPRQSTVQPPSHEPVSTGPKFTVFQPPSSNTASKTASGPPQSHQGAPIPFSFTPKPPSSSQSKGPTAALTSPSKNKSKPTFSAAFAPPTTRPTPQKASSSAKRSPSKRPRAEESDTDTGNPSPAKRLVVAGKWPHATAHEQDHTTAASSPKPKPLSPSKKAPFQVPPGSAAPRPSALRRPSGYFARRKSLGTGLNSNVAEENGAPAATIRSSPKKKAGLGLGRASLGSGSAEAWTRFEKDGGSDPGHAKEKETEAHECAREASRQATASPSSTRGSPAPASPKPSSIRSVIPHASTNPAGTASPVIPVVDISTLVGPEEFGESDTIEQREGNPMEQWREGIEPSEFADDDEPPISIEQFFEMTRIKFMDEVTAPRRSTHPSQQPSHQARNPADIPISDYTIAMGIDIPQLILYSRVSRDLQAWVEKSKADFAQAEDEAAKITPELFTEYSRADEEGKAELLHQLQLIRTNTRGLAKSDWYDWKLQWLEGLRITADKVFKSLEADAKILEGITVATDEVLPALQKEYEEIMQELEKENAEVAEIEASDQDYLNELKASIAEQNIEVEALQAEVAEGQAQLLWLRERLEEVDDQKREASTAIADAQRILRIQKNSTRAEVFKLAEELEALEDLHMFRATKVGSDLFEYVYASQLRVSIPCRNYMPLVARVEVAWLDKFRSRYKDDFPRLSNFLLDMSKQHVGHGGKGMVVRQIVQRLNDYWSSCAQLRSQLKLLTIKYPVEIEILQTSAKQSSSFKAKVMVLFPAIKAKAFVSFVFDTATFCYWPISIASLQYDVEVAYGPIETDPILKAVTERLQQASLEDNYACLLDACIQAQDVYQ